MKVIIQGFGSKPFLFDKLISKLDNVIILSNYSNSYLEVETQLLQIALKYKVLDIMGWSLGSIYALNFALNYPDKAGSLFLTGATARFTERDDYQNGVSKGVVEKMKLLIKRRKELVIRDFYSNIFEKVANKSDLIDKLVSDLQTDNALDNGLDSLLNYDLLDSVKKIYTPIFIYHGIYDTITPKEGAIAIDKLAPNSTMILTDGGHSLFLEKPIECSELWKKFLCQTKR